MSSRAEAAAPKAAVLDALEYRMTVATPMSFLPRYFQAAGIDGNGSDMRSSTDAEGSCAAWLSTRATIWVSAPAATTGSSGSSAGSGSTTSGDGSGSVGRSYGSGRSTLESASGAVESSGLTGVSSKMLLEAASSEGSLSMGGSGEVTRVSSVVSTGKSGVVRWCPQWGQATTTPGVSTTSRPWHAPQATSRDIVVMSDGLGT